MSNSNQIRTVGQVKVVRFAGEWIVKVWDTDGKRWSEADYFTNDQEDANQTASRISGISVDTVNGVRVQNEQ
jgi:hypothetical protein